MTDEDRVAYQRGVRDAAAALAALRHPAGGKPRTPDGYPCTICGTEAPTVVARIREGSAIEGWSYTTWGWACETCLADTLGELDG